MALLGFELGLPVLEYERGASWDLRFGEPVRFSGASNVLPQQNSEKPLGLMLKHYQVERSYFII